jgi:dihydrodipicolinate synthase/N-acetylneuraminate lyase
MSAIDPLAMLRPRRTITGISAVLLPFTNTGEVDWLGFTAHLERTASARLIPAVNMDTGYVNLLDEAMKQAVLERTNSVMAGRPFTAGAFVDDRPGAALDLDRYRRTIREIEKVGGTPVIFPSYGLTALGNEALVDAYRQIGRECERFIAFELGTMFAPFGRIYSLEVYRELLTIKACVGAKHSSLSRQLEWQRLQLRDEVRPEFQVFTGHDLAIDMVMYGSDYLLGLSTFAPDYFARRDRYWLEGDPRFYELNDVLQYLGFLAFREPVPAYKHSAAMFLKLRGWLDSDAPHPQSARRPESDRELLAGILRQLEALS